MAAFTCTSRPPVSLRSESRIASSPSASLSARRMFTLSPDSAGLRIRLSQSPSSLTSKVPRPRRGIVCEAQETTTDSMSSLYSISLLVQFGFSLCVSIVNDTTWDSLVLKADGPVLVDFWAPWCGPCKMIDPLVNELAKEYTGKVKFYKLNTDDSPSTPSKYNVRSIPTIMIFVNGEKKDAIIGAVPRSTLASSIDKFLQ
ncbi:hypothetical protein HID58_010663 [Brassica napus]|uniref:Thioredoxin domain-containing protein n=2 Tax=Brassica TaxID=3705 RepID=A0ABQ8DYM5_BRANA|nr:hypothetical protein HID58_010663 [Brassica napus]